MRVLYITTISVTMSFFTHFIMKLVEGGNVVDIACGLSDLPVLDSYRKMGCKIYEIGTTRSPLDIKNIQAISKIRRIVEEGKYDLVHCHTPIAAAVTRVACRPLRKKGIKVFYTAHGFHFYDGAPLKNWLIYYPIEKYLSRYTDILITINKEDYNRAKKKFRARKTVYVPGVGVDIEKFAPRQSGREKVRAELGLDNNEIMLLSVGELNRNKNHEAVIEAIKGMKITYVIVGKGDKENELRSIAEKLGVDLRLTGYRNDVSDFYDAADVYILPSLREGLNVSLMEAMASGLPVVCGKIRGNTDLVKVEKCLFDPSNTAAIRKAVDAALKNKDIIGKQNAERIKTFDLHTVEKLTSRIYLGANT